MKPVKFEGHNFIFAKNSSDYLPLPAKTSSSGDVLSCWALTILERLKVLFTGRIYLYQRTFRTPLQPVILTTKRLDMEVPKTCSESEN